MGKTCFEHIDALRKSAIGILAGYVLWTTIGNCGLTEMDLTLMSRTFHGDLSLMVPMGISSVPSVPCSSAVVCANDLALVGLVDKRITPTCDLPAGNCGADINMLLTYTIDLSHDPGVTSGAVNPDWIRNITLKYGIDSTLNVDIQKIDVYLGPGSATSPTAQAVNQIGTVGPVPKMSMSTPDDAHALVIADGTPAHDEYIGFLKDAQDPFRLLLVVSLHLQAGDPIPSGGIDVTVVPQISVLKR